MSGRNGKGEKLALLRWKRHNLVNQECVAQRKEGEKPWICTTSENIRGMESHSHFVPTSAERLNTSPLMRFFLCFDDRCHSSKQILLWERTEASTSSQCFHEISD